MKTKAFLLAMLAEFVSYGIFVIDARAITSANYLWLVFTNLTFITQAFFVSKWMVEAKEARGIWAYLGFLIGGTAGSLSAMWVALHLIGHAR